MEIKLYPKSEIFGYQGITHYSQYMNTIPAKYEEEAKVVPKKILTIGRAYKNLKKEFFKSADVSIAPALNYQFLFKKPCKRIFSILCVFDRGYCVYGTFEGFICGSVGYGDC